MDEEVKELTHSDEAAERYQYLGRIGTGGSHVVHKLYDTVRQQPVAIKVLMNGFTLCEKTIVRFIREAKTLSTLQHPHIVKGYYWEFSLKPKESKGYFIMEYIDNGSLRQDIEQRKAAGVPLAAADYAREINMQITICEALDYLHTQGIVARDLKPDHILFSSQRQLKLIDFGSIHLSPKQRSLLHDPYQTDPGGILGTPGYMSPEQAQGHEIDHRSDIYSLGIILYELLSNRLPFNEGEVMYQHIHVRPVRPKEFNPTIPDALEEIIMMCLEKNPDRRPQTALELKKHFEGFLRDYGSEVR